MKNYIKLNNFTYAEKENPFTIHFYFEKAMSNDTNNLTNSLSIVFELCQTNNKKEYEMYVFLINDSNEAIWRSYSIPVTNVGNYKFVINSDKQEIDFINIDYTSFTSLIANKELIKLVPEMEKEIRRKTTVLSKRKEMVKEIDVPSKLSFVINVSGYLVNEMEKLVTTEEEKELSKRILKNVKKNTDVIINDKESLDIAYLSLYGLILNNSNRKDIKEIAYTNKDLKVSTNLEIDFNTLNNEIDNLIQKKELGDLGSRINDILNSNKNGEFTKYNNILIAADKFLDKDKSGRVVSDIMYKDFIIRAFNNLFYIPLPNNLILLFNLDNLNVNLLSIISLDRVLELFNCYDVQNTHTVDKKEYVRTINNLIKRDSKNNLEYIVRVNLLCYFLVNLYYFRMVNQDILLFDKGSYIIDLDFVNGEYNISIMNRITKKKLGKLVHLTEKTKDVIRNSLDHNEKMFNQYINNLIYNNLGMDLLQMKLNLYVKELSHEGIVCYVEKVINNDAFQGYFNLGDILTIFTEVKYPRPDKKKVYEEIKQEQISKKDEYIYGILKEDYDFIYRKASTISNLVKHENFRNTKYSVVTELLDKFMSTSEHKERHDILLEIADELGFKDIRVKEDR